MKKGILYKIPENWKIVSLEEVAIIVTGNTPSTNIKSYFNGDIPFFKPSDLNQGFVNDSKDKLSLIGKEFSRTLPKGSILVTCIGSTIGKTGIISKEGAFNQQINGVLPILSNPLFFYYQIISSNFQKLIKENSSATTVPILNKSKFGKLPFIIAPLSEQNLIVEKIEKLFSELDYAEKLLKNAKQQLEIYKEVLLKDAFEGKLTERWREDNYAQNADLIFAQLESERELFFERQLLDWNNLLKKWAENKEYEKKPLKPKGNNLLSSTKEKNNFSVAYNLPVSWKWVHWEEILDYKEDAFKRGPFGSTLTKSIFVKSGYKVYEQYCPINDDCSFERYFITTEKFEELKTFSVREGDYLISCSGSIGKITQVPNTYKEGIINQALLRIRINKKYIDFKFFLYFFRSPYFQKQIIANSKGSTISNIKGVKELKIIPVPLVCIEEQKKIVEILELRFTLIDNLERTIGNTLHDIFILRHSILKKSFEGKLVNQVVNDENAYEFLKRIKVEKKSYLQNEKKLVNNKPKKERSMEAKRTILEILKNSNAPISSEELWVNSIHEGDIEGFYNEIKEIYNNLNEVKEEMESLLSLKK